jgi:hypothetical protein
MAAQSARIATKSAQTLNAESGRATTAPRTEEQPTPASCIPLFGSAERVADAQLKALQMGVGVLCDSFARSGLISAGRILPLLARVGFEANRSATESVIDATRDVILGTFDQLNAARREMVGAAGGKVDADAAWNIIQASLDHYSATAEALAACSTEAANKFTSQWKEWLPEAE